MTDAGPLNPDELIEILRGSVDLSIGALRRSHAEIAVLKAAFVNIREQCIGLCDDGEAIARRYEPIDRHLILHAIKCAREQLAACEDYK